MATNHIDLLQEAIRLHHELVPFCTVTVADARGSIPQEIGAKALINRDGLICGTIGGGKIEARGCEKARELLAPGSKQHTLLERINLHKDVGMTCAGEMTLPLRGLSTGFRLEHHHLRGRPCCAEALPSAG